MLVSVLILNWNGREHLEECISSLVEGCGRDDVEFVVVDNASNDGSTDYVREKFSYDGRVKVLALDRNYGWSGGNNRGIEKCMENGTKYIFLLNNDTKVEKGCIERLIEFSEEHPEVGAVAPKILLYDQPFLINSVGLECSIIGSAWDRGIGRVDTSEWNKVTEVVGVCGAGMWLRSEALKKTGLLPEEFEIYLDDLDLCLRMWMSGYKILTCPEAVIHHKFSMTWKINTERERRKYYLNTRNRFWLMERNFPKEELLKIISYVLLGEAKAIGNSIKKCELWRIEVHVKSWMEALRYLWKIKGGESSFLIKDGNPMSFWSLVRRSPLFCPMVKLPTNGWYKDDIVSGIGAHPISKFAWMEVKSKELELTVYNLMPELREVNLEIKLADGRHYSVRTTHREKVRLENLPPLSRIEIEANNLFKAEETGKEYDIGGWIKIEAT